MAVQAPVTDGAAGSVARRRLLPAAVFITALAVRLLYAFTWGGEHHRVVTGDAAEYQAYAVNLLDRGVYENALGERASRMPGYPLLLAGVYKAFGRSPALVVFLQCVLGAAGCALLALTARGRLGPAWGWAGGLMAAFYYDLFAPCAHLLTECPASFLLALFLWFWSERRPYGVADAAAMGACLSLGYLLRPELSLFIPVLAFLVRRWRQGLVVALLFTAAALPWTLRNRAVLGRVIATTSAGPLNCYLGIPRTIHERLGGLPDFPKGKEYGRLGETERMDAYGSLAVELMRQARFFEIVRAWTFNLLIEYYPFLPGYEPTVVLILPFWLWGLWLSRRDPEFRAAAAVTIYLTAIYSVVAVMQSRHRQILGPALVLLAVVGLKDLFTRLGSRRFWSALACWAGFHGMVWTAAPWFRSLALRLRDSL